MATALSALRDREELIANIPVGDAYIDSTDQRDDIREAYQKTAYFYDWPELLVRSATIPTVNVTHFTLPSTFRKFRHLYVLSVEHFPVEYSDLKYSTNSYFVDRDAGDFIVSTIVTTAPTAYNMTNAETAANAVTIELDTVSGLSQHEEIWVDGTTTDEFTIVSSVGTASITARLKNNQSANDKIYRVSEIVIHQFYRTVNTLTAAGDTTLLPTAVDFEMLHYAAHLYFHRNRQFDRAAQELEQWKTGISDIWHAFDKTSSGEVTSFSV